MVRKKSNPITFRLRIISIFIIFTGISLIGWLYNIQIIRGDQFDTEANQQYSSSSGNIYNRGSIFFKEKDGEPFPAASLKSGYKIAISPKTIGSPDKVYDKLSTVLEIDKTDFFNKAKKEDDPYEEIAQHLKREDSIKIKELGLKGVTSHLQRWRYYPCEDLASRIIGFVAYKGDEKTGVYGLERYYEDLLKREDDSLYVNFFAKLFSDIKDTVNKEKSSPGNIETSIEYSVQSFLKNQLEEVGGKYESKLSGGIIINPKTGSIYAMSIRPGFDLNNFKNVDDSSIFSNPLVENVYEMGSIVKALTMAVGIDSGAVNATTTYFDKGQLTLDDYTIYNYDKRGRGEVDMQEVLNQSLNTGAVFVEQEIGSALFANYMKEYGLGEKTGIDLPSETSGLIKNLDSPREIEYATASYGQGIAVTPIGITRALSVLANGGYLITPHIAERIKYENGFSKKVNPPKGKRILKEGTSEQITEMLVKVVDDALLGGEVNLPRYSIAAKTGTAQIANLLKRGYYENRYLHSFFGYLPASDPEFLVFLYTVEPKNVRYASHSLGIPFMNIAEFLINYYKTPPDR